MKLILFDIDGTLLLVRGAGMRAVQKAMMQCLGHTGEVDGVRPDGKTDPQIFREVLARNGRKTLSASQLKQLVTVYLSCLEEELRGGVVEILPGVRDLIHSLSQRQDLLLGIATGNIEAAARLKLQMAGLDSFFSLGGFGSDAEDRTEIIRIACKRASEMVRPARIESTIVVGDTPRDITHGRAAGAKTLAVATGSYSREELETFSPDFVVSSFNPLGPLLEFLR